MNTAEIVALFDKHVVANYRRLPVAIVKGQGSWVWDAEGKKYLDLFPGWGVAGLGHCHPRVAEAVAAQARKLIHVANTFYSEEQGLFAEVLSSRASGQKCFFCNSGAEANEGAIKLARLHSQPRHKVIAFRHSFHGRTFAAISATGQPEYQKGFTPLVPGFVHADLNDLAGVEALVDDQTCAIMVEPVQGEGGVHPCTPEFLRGLRALCDKRKMALIFDEVQTSPARLGTWFGYQHFGVEPDILTTAKAIAGGLPLGLLMAKPEIASSLKPGTHASTFGGNSLGCAAGLAAFRAMEEERVLANIAAQGEHLDRRLAKLARETGAVAEVRRVGFMIGVELKFPGAEVVAACQQAGLLLNCAHERVLRILPAYNISRADLDAGLDILAGCLAAAAKRAEVGA